jgi:signal transduction histidine kinase
MRSEPSNLLTIDAARLKELEKMAEAGQRSARLLHDITSPLTAAILHLENPPNNVQGARQSLTLMHRYVETARQRLTMSEETIRFSTCSLLTELIDVLGAIAREKDIGIELVTDTDYFLEGNPLKFQRIASNLIMNAIESYEGVPRTAGRSVIVTLSLTRTGLIQLAVSDNGRGISSQHINNIFTAFYTTKKYQRVPGLGLGLTSVKKYVEQSFGGKVYVQNRSGGGCTFYAVFPPHTASSSQN